MASIPVVDFKAIFQTSPGLFLILAPDFTIVAVSDAYLKATMTEREAILGRGLFDVFPDNPDDIEADGVSNLRASLNYVLQHRQPHTMAVQKYDIRRPDGVFEVRYWSPLNTPVFTAENELAYIIHNVTDVTSQQLTEAKLRKSESDYQLLVEHVRDYAIFMVDVNGCIASWNRGAESIKGYTAEEIIGQPIDIFYPEADIQRGIPKSNLQTALQQGRFETEGWRRRKDGSLFWANIVITALKDKAGTLYGYSKITRDITERKNYEDQLELLSRQINQSNDAIFTTDAGRKIKSWNLGAQHLYGYTAAEALEQDSYMLLKTDITSKQLDDLLTEIATNDYWSGELLRKTKAGVEINVWSSATTLRDSAGKITGYVAVSYDITAQKALREEVNHLASIVEQSSEAIMSRGIDQRFLSWNRGAEKLFGYTKEEAIGKTPMDLRFTKFTEEEIAGVSRQLLEKGVWNSEMEFFHKSGRSFFGTVTGNTVKNGRGKISALVFIIKDISVHKQLEDQLKNYNAELEKEVKARTEDIIRNESRFRALIENSNDIVSLMDASFNVFYRSPSAYRITGWTDEEMINTPGTKNVHPDDIDKAKSIVQELMANPGKPITCLFRNQHKNGNYMWLEGVVVNLLHDKYVNAIVFNFRNVTERIEAEEKIAASEKFFRALIENSNDIITLMDESFRLVYQSPAAARLTGWTNEDMIGVKAIKNIHPEDLAAAQATVTDIMASPGKLIHSRFRMQHKAGHYIWVEGSFTNLLHDRNVKAVIFNFRDVSARIEGEEKLKQSFAEKQVLAKRMSIILNTLPANIALLDSRGTIIDVNDAWRNFADHNGFTGSNYCIGDNYIKVTAKATRKEAEDGKKVAAGIKAVLRNRLQEFVYEYPCDSPDIKRWFRMIVTPLQEKEFPGAVVMHIDISELRRLEQERLKAKVDEQKKITKAMLMGQEKERNHLGQELHDNINQILAGTKLFLALAGKKNKEVKELIKYPMEMLDTSIDEIRTLCHKMVTPLKNVHLEELTRDLLHKLDQATGIKARFVYAVPDGKISDELQLNIYRIIQELVNNINKYSGAKKISVTIKERDKAIAITVTDNGRGFDAEKKRKGVGISNIMNRVASFNGKITIKSAEGNGCTTSINIPC